MIKSGQRNRKPMHQNDLWLKDIRTLMLFFVQLQGFDTASCNF